MTLSRCLRKKSLYFVVYCSLVHQQLLASHPHNREQTHLQSPLSNYKVDPHPVSYFIYKQMWKPKYTAMELVILIVLSYLFTQSLSSRAAGPKPISQITVMGVVFCDICSNNTFTKHSYFLPGAEVKVDCTFKAISPETSEEITFSVKRTTNKFGMYKLDIPAVDGIECAEESAVVSSCQASLMRTSSSSCNVPGYRSTTNEISIKSKEANICIYSLNALNYRPSKRDIKKCGN